MRGFSTAKAVPVKVAGPEKPVGQERSKTLEAALEKSKATYKALKSELEGLKTNSVSKEDHDHTLADLEGAKQALASENRRVVALETDLKKSQESLKTLNARANEVDKAQKERGFALQNELSKAREELAVLQARPDNSSSLVDEVERLRESVASATRYAGELRKREAAALAEMEKIKARYADNKLGTFSMPERVQRPAGDSERVAAAKAEVLRLMEENKKRTAEAPVMVEEEKVEPVVVATTVAAVAATVPLVTAIAPVVGLVEPALAEKPVETEPEVAAVVEEEVVVVPVAEESVEVAEISEAVEEVSPVTEEAAPVAEVEAFETVESVAVAEEKAEEAPSPAPAEAEPVVAKAEVKKEEVKKTPQGELFSLE